MTTFQRIKLFLGAIIQMLTGVLIIFFQRKSINLVAIVLSIALIGLGIKQLSYYFSMARYAVDGKMILILGAVLFDFGILAFSISDMPKIYIIIYLAIIHAFSGLVEILRALEARRFGAKSWKLKFSHGVVDVLIVIACFAFINNTGTVSIIYGSGLIYSGLLNIITSFRKTTLVYIQ